MVNMNIHAEWSRDGKYVMLSRDDWEKVLSVLSQVAVINNKSTQQSVQQTADNVCPHCGFRTISEFDVCPCCLRPAAANASR